MSVAMNPEERNQLAAEYALGLLERADFERARALAAEDSEFRAEVGRCSGRLAPLLDEVKPINPPAHVIAAVEQRIAEPKQRGNNVLYLRRRLNLWRGLTAGATALAASLALVLVTRPAPVEQAPAPSEPAAPMVATMAGEDSDAKLVATWDPDDRSLVVAAAAGVEGVEGQSHELWVIPVDGTPRSMGVIPGTAPMHLRVPGAMANQLAEGATLAISVEPTGGSPTGQPTGPVIASGKLERT